LLWLGRGSVIPSLSELNVQSVSVTLNCQFRVRLLQRDWSANCQDKKAGGLLTVHSLKQTAYIMGGGERYNLREITAVHSRTLLAISRVMTL